MPRPPLAPGSHINVYPHPEEFPDEWTWADARPLLAPGSRVRLLGWDDPLFELREDGRWTDDIANVHLAVEERACIVVRVGAEDAPGGELVALPGGARPELPGALAAPDDPVEVQVRDALVEAGARSIELLVADVRANPSRALRRLRVIERVAQVLRGGVAELGLDDEDEGLGDGFEEGGMIGGMGLRRRRRRPGFAGGHAYGPADQQTMLNGAVRAQHMQALVQTIERTGPTGTAPHPAVFEAASRELALLFPEAAPARAAEGEPDGAGDGRIVAPLPPGAPA